MHIISLNGPAGSGKDTIAQLLCKYYGFEALSFKAVMFDVAKAMLGSRYGEFLALYNDRATKEVPSPLLGGLSPRQFFIRISEVWIKPTFGNGYFAERVADAAREVMNRDARMWGDPGYGPAGPRHVVISDGGFDEEAQVLLDAFPQFRVVRLYRDGFTFDGDSRSYITGVPGFAVHLADGQPKQAAEYIVNTLEGIDNGAA